MTGEPMPRHPVVAGVIPSHIEYYTGEIRTLTVLTERGHRSHAPVVPASGVVPPGDSHPALAYRRASWGQPDSSPDPVAPDMR